ncbi:MAG TPA: CsgG/HfaB family protein [Longimicrobiales bacterium]
MHTRTWLALLLLGVTLAAPLSAQKADSTKQDRRPGIAVFPFANGGSFGSSREDLAPLEIGIQQMLLTELAQNDSLRVVDRSVLKGILEEQNLATAGRVDAATAARVGKLVGARYVVTGAFMDISGRFRLDGRVVDVETSEVLRTQSVNAKRDELYSLLVQLAGKITKGVKLPPLPEHVREAREARAIPAEAVTLYSRAQVYQDAGRTEKAIELYRMIAQKFPQMTEARQALVQLNAAS